MPPDEIAATLRYADELIEFDRLTPGDVTLLTRLLRRYSKGQDAVKVTAAEWAGDGIDRSTVFRALKRLEAAFLVVRENTSGIVNGRWAQGANIYHLHTAAAAKARAIEAYEREQEQPKAAPDVTVTLLDDNAWRGSQFAPPSDLLGIDSTLPVEAEYGPDADARNPLPHDNNVPELDAGRAPRAAERECGSGEPPAMAARRPSLDGVGGGISDRDGAPTPGDRVDVPGERETVAGDPPPTGTPGTATRGDLGRDGGRDGGRDDGQDRIDVGVGVPDLLALAAQRAQADRTKRLRRAARALLEGFSAQKRSFTSVQREPPQPPHKAAQNGPISIGEKHPDAPTGPNTAQHRFV